MRRFVIGSYDPGTLPRRKWLQNRLKNAVSAMLWMELRTMKFTRMRNDSSEDTGNVDIEGDDTSDIDSDGEFLAFYDV